MQGFDNYSAQVPVIQTQVLLVEDETVFAKAVRKHLQRQDYQVNVAGDLETAGRLFKEKTPDLILLDMRLPDGSGLDLLEEFNNSNNNVPIIVMSAYGELEDAVSAMKLGASDYLKKPVDPDELSSNIRKVLDKNEISKKLTYSNKREQHAVESVEFLGDCKAINSIRKQVQRIAHLSQKTSVIPPTVLILGETGTGKDVVARLSHANSNRMDKPFVHVDCASLPKDLIESELFGHEKGAFTNAHVARTGLIEAAEDGALFLDEIGELPLDLQSKLLAVLERRTLRRVGTTQERPVAAWIIAATNRDLESLSDRGEFRSDLFYRLNVMSLTMPPLRERGDDILLLANHFAAQTVRRYGLDIEGFDSSAKAALLEYDWPGNVREMKHLLERAVLLSGGGKIGRDILNLDMSEKSSGELAKLDEDMTLGDAELQLIKQALD